MTATSISDLPPELLLKIWELLPKADLAAISRASREMRHTTEPMLYYSIHMRRVGKGGKMNPPIKLLLRTFLERPELPRLVHRLFFNGRYEFKGWCNPYRSLWFWEVGDFDMLPKSCALPSDKISEITETLAVSSEIARYWSGEILAGNTDAVVALIAAMAPNLRELFIDQNWTFQTRYFGQVARAACRKETKRKPFASLKDVSIYQYADADTHRSPHDANDMLCLFDLPEIQHISIPILNPIEFSWPFPTVSSLSNVTSLELTRIRECFLEDVLSRVANLQKLRFTLLYRRDVDRHASKHIIDFDAMLGAFSKHKDTLVELEIEGLALMTGSDIESPRNEPRGSLQYLSQLHKLKKLEIPFNFLAGMVFFLRTGSITSALPSNLEHLTLGYDMAGSYDTDFDCYEDEDMLAYVRAELESGGLANLRSICMPPLDPCVKDEPGHQAEMNYLSKRFNVSLSTIPRSGKLEPSFGCFAGRAIWGAST